MLGKDNETLEALEKSDGLLKDAPIQQARNASLAGVIHFRKGDIQKALVCHQKDLELSNALVKNEDAHPLITLRAKHNCAISLCRQGNFRPAPQEYDPCAKLLDESTVVPEDADGLFRGASPATVQARALYHAARATQAPSLDVGARSRLERAASLLAPPDEPMRAEDALLGAFVQLALGQRRLDDSELELVERSIDAARRPRPGHRHARRRPSHDAQKRPAARRARKGRAARGAAQRRREFGRATAVRGHRGGRRERRGGRRQQTASSGPRSSSRRAHRAHATMTWRT